MQARSQILGSGFVTRLRPQRLSETALAGNPRTTAEWDLRTEAGEAGGNPQAGRRRREKTRHTDGDFIMHFLQLRLGMLCLFGFGLSCTPSRGASVRLSR